MKDKYILIPWRKDADGNQLYTLVDTTRYFLIPRGIKSLTKDSRCDIIEEVKFFDNEDYDSETNLT